MGGDEFCALFEPRGDDSATLLEGAALALSEQGEGFWIGCSYGSITLPGEATDAAEALRIADQRMYAQKNAGRMSAARQVKEALLAALERDDPRLEADARAVAELADAAARSSGLSRDERETVRHAAELLQVGRLAAAARRTSTPRPSASSPPRPRSPSAARLLRALDQRGTRPARTIPLGARIVAAAAFAAEHGADGCTSTPARASTPPWSTPSPPRSRALI